jgi:hypothetical protein
LVDPLHQGSSADKDSTDDNDDNVAPHCSSGAGIHKSNSDVTDNLTNNCDGQEHDDLRDFDNHISTTDAEVSKVTFIEHLVHYMEGECISMSNHKLIEIFMMIESGTYVQNMDLMKRDKQEEIILRKYTSINNDIEDHQFEMASVCTAMLQQYSGRKKQHTGATLWRKMEKVMTDMRLFASKFPGVNSTSNLPSRLTQLCHMKQPHI